jgi:hypothetical protein
MSTSTLASNLVEDQEKVLFVAPRPTSAFWTRHDGQMCIQSFRPEGDLFFPAHTYSEYTVVVCLEGELSKSQLGQNQVIGQGEAIVGNHGVEHTSRYWARNGKR